MRELGLLCIQTHPSLPNIQLFVFSQEKKAKERHVQRFLYTLWSSKKQPDVQSLVELLLAVRRCTPHWRRVGPLLLHCRYPWLPCTHGQPPTRFCTVPWHGTKKPSPACPGDGNAPWEPVEVLSLGAHRALPGAGRRQGKQSWAGASMGGAGTPRLRCPGHPWVAAGPLGAALVSSLAQRAHSPTVPAWLLGLLPSSKGVQLSLAWHQ